MLRNRHADIFINRSDKITARTGRALFLSMCFVLTMVHAGCAGSHKTSFVVMLVDVSATTTMVQVRESYQATADRVVDGLGDGDQLRIY